MDTEALTTQVVVGAIFVWGFNKLKAASWFPFVNFNTERLNRWINVVVAGLLSFGIHTQFGFDHASGVFSLTIDGLLVGSLLEHGKDWILSWMFQHFGYKTAKTLENS